MAESVTITDNRTGESIEIPIVERRGRRRGSGRSSCPASGSTIRRSRTTAAAASSITELDGEAGILRYRGYPIEQLAEQSTYLEVAYLLIHGELPDRRAVRGVEARHHLPHVHPRERAQALHGGLPPRRPPHGHPRLDRSPRSSTFYPEAKDIEDADSRDKQIIRLIAKMPTLAAGAYRHSRRACRSSTRTTASTSRRTSCR